MQLSTPSSLLAVQKTASSMNTAPCKNEIWLVKDQRDDTMHVYTCFSVGTERLMHENESKYVLKYTLEKCSGS
jgi:hypothetical protein